MACGLWQYVECKTKQIRLLLLDSSALQSRSKTEKINRMGTTQRCQSFGMENSTGMCYDGPTIRGPDDRYYCCEDYVRPRVLPPIQPKDVKTATQCWLGINNSNIEWIPSISISIILFQYTSRKFTTAKLFVDWQIERSRECDKDYRLEIMAKKLRMSRMRLWAMRNLLTASYYHE